MDRIPAGDEDAHVIPEPVSVAELRRRRLAHRNRYFPADPYLDHAEIAAAWPSVWRIDAVIEAHGVRVTRESATGTYGTTSWSVFNGDDVQRVADKIAAGTADLNPEWTVDNPVGRAKLAERQQERAAERRRSRRIGAMFWLVVGIAFATLIVVMVVNSG